MGGGAAKRPRRSKSAIDPSYSLCGRIRSSRSLISAARNASVGTNTDPADGVEGYQGENSISIDPNNPLHLIAFSNTFFKDPTATCQSPTGGTANTFGTMALFGSTDGGATWTYNCAPWPAADHRRCDRRDVLVRQRSGAGVGQPGPRLRHLHAHLPECVGLRRRHRGGPLRRTTAPAGRASAPSSTASPRRRRATTKR